MGVPYAEVIGDPIAHSKSPLIHNFWLEKLGLQGEYRRTRVTADELPAYLATRRDDPDWRGCNVTLPHKNSILPFLDESRLWGLNASNCVLPEAGRLIGQNTDVAGLGEALPFGVDTRSPVCLIGAGGAAEAAIAHLDIVAVYQFNLIVRDRAKAAVLVGHYGEYGRTYDFAAAPEAMRGCVGVINASPLGMAGFEQMPTAVLESLALLDRDAFVFDMVYAPLETSLLRAAKVQGFQAIDGLTMLVGQAAAAFEHFFGTPAPREYDAELRAILTQ